MSLFFFFFFIQAIKIKVNGWPAMYRVLVKQIFVFFCFSVIIKLIFMALIPGRFSQSRSALRWSINSIQTPTPPWRFSTHVSTSSALLNHPLQYPLCLLTAPLGRRNNSPRKRAIAVYSQTKARHKFCSQRVFSYKQRPVVNFARGGCKHFMWQMYTHLIFLLEACVHCVRVHLHIKEW